MQNKLLNIVHTKFLLVRAAALIRNRVGTSCKSLASLEDDASISSGSNFSRGCVSVLAKWTLQKARCPE